MLVLLIGLHNIICKLLAKTCSTISSKFVKFKHLLFHFGQDRIFLATQ